MAEFNDGIAETQPPQAATVTTDVLIVGSGPGRGVGGPVPVHPRRPEHHDHQVPLDGEHAAGAHHQPADDGDLPRPGHRGQVLADATPHELDRRHRVLHLDRRRGDRPDPHLGHPPAREADYQLASPSLNCDIPQTYLEPILVSNATDARHPDPVLHRVPLAHPGRRRRQRARSWTGSPASSTPSGPST